MSALRNYKIEHKVTLTIEECIVCGICFAIPEEFRANLVRRGGYFHCPVGHSQGWDQGEEARAQSNLKRKLEEAQKQLDAKQLELQAERKRKEWAEQDAKQKSDKLAVLQKRTHAGTCPCCQRTFKQLAAHMKNKHPEVAPKATTNAVNTKINRRKKADFEFAP
jgi:Fe-S oxidoreductase